MKFGTGSNNELTQKNDKVKVQNDIRTSKQTSPIFKCVTPVSVLLANARSPIIHLPVSNDDDNNVCIQGTELGKASS